MKTLKFSELKAGETFTYPGKPEVFVKLSGWALIAVPDEEIGDEYKNAVNIKTGELEGVADKDDVIEVEIFFSE